MQLIDKRETSHWHHPPALFWLRSYMDRHRLAAAQQSRAKDQFYSTVYYKTIHAINKHKRIERLLIGTACLPCFG